MVSHEPQRRRRSADSFPFHHTLCVIFQSLRPPLTPPITMSRNTYTTPTAEPQQLADSMIAGIQFFQLHCTSDPTTVETIRRKLRARIIAISTLLNKRKRPAYHTSTELGVISLLVLLATDVTCSFWWAKCNIIKCDDEKKKILPCDHLLTFLEKTVHWDYMHRDNMNTEDLFSQAILKGIFCAMQEGRLTTLSPRAYLETLMMEMPKLARPPILREAQNHHADGKLSLYEQAKRILSFLRYALGDAELDEDACDTFECLTGFEYASISAWNPQAKRRRTD